jgi:hypothetical protein
MILREIVLLLYQAVLFDIGMATTGLAAHPGGVLIAGASGVDELIPTAVISFRRGGTARLDRQPVLARKLDAQSI